MRDADEILARMRVDTASEWPQRLLAKLETVRVDLTEMEKRVLMCYAAGLERRMVAEVLGISPATVEKHARFARYRLMAKTTTQAVANAIRQGLIA